jgi:deoxyribose-phosphate aldolase
VASITALCHKAISTVGQVAAVCVYPQFVATARGLLAGTTVNIATVANFPQGVASIDEVLLAIDQALKAGAQEIDVVFPYQRYLAGDTEVAQEFVSQCKKACGDKLLKVILETGAFEDLSVLEQAAITAVNGGADFLKTSTGKIPVGATPKTAEVLLSVIKKMQPTVATQLGFKASGGVRTIEQAAGYIALANQILGAEWVTPKTFRLGASQLLDAVLASF